MSVCRLSRGLPLVYAIGMIGSLSAAPAAALTVAVSGPFSGSTSAGYVDAKDAESDFISSFDINDFNVTTEDFESFPLQTLTVGGSLDTKVGTFTQIEKGQIDAGLRILDSVTTPFGGRRDMTSDTFTTPGTAKKSGTDTHKWLDSNDSKEVEWVLDLDRASSAVGFFMTDVNDVSASMVAQFVDGTQQQQGLLEFAGENGTAGNGEVIYVTADFGSSLVTSIKFIVNKKNDGWGIDNVTAVAPVPLPAAAWFALTGFGTVLGFGGLRRRRQTGTVA